MIGIGGAWMRADRLLSILLVLQTEGKQTTRALAGRLEVSERTVLRDMEALSSAGVPVYAERGSGGGWRLMPDYRTDLTGMKPDELLALLVAAHPRLIHDLDIRRHYDAAFHKLLASSPLAVRQDMERLREKVHIDGAGWHRTSEACPCLPVVQEAVWGERRLAMTYGRELTVSPLGLVAKGTVWYMIAAADADLRTYRVSRIREARLLDERVVRPADFELAAYWEQSTAAFKRQLPIYPARLALAADAVEQLRQTRYAQVVRVDGQAAEARTTTGGRGPAAAEPDCVLEAGAEPRLTVDALFNTLESACGIVLSLGAQAEVLFPPGLRLRTAIEAAAIARRYE